MPLLLRENALVWFTSSTHKSDKSFEEFSDALVKQFPTESDIWLLRQQLLNRKQLPNETVAQFASEIRRLCYRLAIPEEGSINYLVLGLLSVVSLTSSRSVLTNYDSIIPFHLSYEINTKDLPPPYVYKVPRKRKPPDKSPYSGRSLG